MRAWKVVAVINLALLIGAGWGYVFWGLRVGRLERELGEPPVAVPRVFEPDFSRAVDRVQDSAATMIVTGSFHTVGDALARLPGFAPVG